MELSNFVRRRCLHNRFRTLLPATLSMSDFQLILCNLVDNLSDGNYDESFAQYRLWLDIGGAHGNITQNQFNSDMNRVVGSGSLRELIHTTAHLLIRFIEDAEVDRKISRYASGLHQRRSTSALNSFFGMNLRIMGEFGDTGSWVSNLLTNANFIARWANLGYVEEETVRNRILQSLIAHPKLHDHQVDALIVLFKLAGATFAVYADPSVVDRCFKLLKGYPNRDSTRLRLIQVSTPSVGGTTLMLR
jgi:hypothetical protein